MRRWCCRPIRSMTMPRPRRARAGLRASRCASGTCLSAWRLDPGLARMTADQWLHDHRLQRRQVRFALPPQAARVQPGDVIRFVLPVRRRRAVTASWRIEDGEMRRVEAVAHAGAAAGPRWAKHLAPAPRPIANAYFAPDLVFLDLPVISGTDETGLGAGGSFWPAHGAPWCCQSSVGGGRLCRSADARCAGEDRRAGSGLAGGRCRRPV